MYLAIRLWWLTASDEAPEREDLEVKHPYAVGILMGMLSILLVFRLQTAYHRYWEAATSVHHMMSKWMDATTHAGVYHLQCSHYNHIKPPSFFEYPDLDRHGLMRQREQFSRFETADTFMTRAHEKSIESVRGPQLELRVSAEIPRNASNSAIPEDSEKPRPNLTSDEPRLDGNWGALFDDGKATFFDPNNPEKRPYKGFAGNHGGRTAPLFLQELAHLSSLLAGVALATLRNDVEGSVSPLDYYYPGMPWPEVDSKGRRGKEFDTNSSTYVLSSMLYFMGMARSAKERTKYNASRPMHVLGGVSEGEIKFLQLARGPYAKTQLCWQWLSEFIIREHLAGSLGNVGPPIISRIIQFLGDGMIYYNHARKIMTIPFPFVHAQLTAWGVIASVPIVALLMDQYTDNTVLGSSLTFLVISFLFGIHEVARELENPFRNVPNELPLNTFQAQYNEALITMYSGYHPDLFWREKAETYAPTNGRRQSTRDSKAEASVRHIDEEELPERKKDM